MAIALRTAGEIDAIDAAARAAQSVLADLCSLATLRGSTGLTLDKAARDLIATHRAEAMFVDHVSDGGARFGHAVAVFRDRVSGVGRPTEEPIASARHVTIDVGLRLDGWCADVARPAGGGDELGIARDATRRLVAEMRPGAIWGEVAARGLTGAVIDRSTVGHGIGRRVHEAPRLTATGAPGEAFALEPGMVLCVEPIVAARVNGDQVRHSFYSEVMVAVVSGGVRVLGALNFDES